MDDRIDQRLSGKGIARQTIGHQDRQRQAADDADHRDPQTQLEDAEFVRAESEHGLLRQSEAVFLPGRSRRRRAQVVEQRLCRRATCSSRAAPPDRRSADSCPAETCRRSARPCRTARRSSRRCRTAPRRATRAPARRARSRRARPASRRRPDAQFLERGLAVFAGRHAVGIGHRELFLPERGRETEIRADLERRLARRRRDQHERVAQQIDARIRHRAGGADRRSPSSRGRPR